MTGKEVKGKISATRTSDIKVADKVFKGKYFGEFKGFPVDTFGSKTTITPLINRVYHYVGKGVYDIYSYAPDASNTSPIKNKILYQDRFKLLTTEAVEETFGNLRYAFNQDFTYTPDSKFPDNMIKLSDDLPIVALVDSGKLIAAFTFESVAEYERFLSEYVTKNEITYRDLFRYKVELVSKELDRVLEKYQLSLGVGNGHHHSTNKVVIKSRDNEKYKGMSIYQPGRYSPKQPKPKVKSASK